MICPNCGNDVPESKFCENCGSPLPAPAPQPQPEQPAQVAPQQAQPAGSEQQPAYAGTWGQGPDGYAPTAADPADPASPNYQTAEIPVPGAPGAAQAGAPYGAGPQAAYAPAVAPAGAAEAPSTALVLVIIGLVLSLLGITFIPGLVLSIIGLVLNSKYSKQGLNNTHKTPTTVVGVIGVVVGALVLVTLIAFGALFGRVYQVLEENDFDPESIEVVTDDDTGEVTIRSKSGDAVHVSGNGSSGSVSIRTGGSVDGAYLDAQGNPAFNAFLELDGSQLADLVEGLGYEWNEVAIGWFDDDNYVYVEGPEQDLTLSETKALKAGGAGTAAAYYFFYEDYPDAESAIKSLSKDIVLEETITGGTVGAYGRAYGLIYGPSMERYIVEVDAMDGGVLGTVYNKEAISAGQLSLTGPKESVKAAWDELQTY